ncbi:cysteine desulfurase-like protein [Polymorphobacter fuscus]|uniref:Cysteine desulfurase-like protein n=1 Tax=Sandarakinorhabdus fusca TaxID=1439888 RepID=A0A7C9KXJ7_9SPHN|nr:cysteine desulfurase-like protein [Polymorphobacter fuscus]KAB7645509.1 cysteine desulfurase-like protein [Polymorphobacter fuscus]MQT17945.1 cysteine desulfurase-like protein [Polymorphobacter fuscus]NJC08575.1 cysteine desulfurase family protein (TIGR01976 family) [Polymorphobacter fuscus]
MTSAFPIDTVRAAFPALALTDDGVARCYFDAPAGTQVAGRVIDAMGEAMLHACANDGGHFRTSQAASAIVVAAHEAAAALFNCDADEIVFGLNTTSLFFAFASLLSRDWQAGDEIVLTRMDHDANVAPWLQAAADRGVTVRWLEWDRDSFEFRLDRLDRLIGPRTRLVAVGQASNFLGTINDVARVCAAARSVGAVTVVDAVQSAPHIAIDVRAVGCDILCASAYKYFGPHAATLFLSRALQGRLQPWKVRPSADTMPTRFSPGTPSFEAQAGTLAAIEHFAWLGVCAGGAAADAPLRTRLMAGFDAVNAYETDLMRHFLAGLATLPDVTLHGIGNANRLASRVPTFTFTLAGHESTAVAQALAARNIFCWSGYFYAWEPATVLALRDGPGAVRIGLSHYNTAGEVDRLIAALGEITSG